MKRFLETVDQTTKPGTYLSGDAVDLSSLNRRTGFGPDSYKAIIKQGLIPGHQLRFSRNTFMKLNSSAVDNSHLYE